MSLSQPFLDPQKRPHRDDDNFTREEVRLANRNHGALLETLRLDVTPTGTQYLLNHFDVPIIDPGQHKLRFTGAFQNPYELDLAEIRELPQVTMPVTMECAGNGRAGIEPRSCSMPWMYEAVGTSEWIGTPLAPLIKRADPLDDVVDFSFTGTDYGFDRGHPHYYGRALSPDQLEEAQVLLVWGMNGQDLLPQHGAPLRIIVPGWYGMASVKWLAEIEALQTPYQGFQQTETYRFRHDHDDPGRPVSKIRVKSLMVPPGVPDWLTRRRFVTPGQVEIIGRAWSGGGVPIERVELDTGNDQWIRADVTPGSGPFAWSRWSAIWQATPGEHILRCRAWDANGMAQPLDPVWDLSGFANNAVQQVEVFVPDISDQ